MNSGGMTLPYHWFEMDCEKILFLYNVKQEGWMLGLTWAFKS